jgi:hypothetical protein
MVEKHKQGLKKSRQMTEEKHKHKYLLVSSPGGLWTQNQQDIIVQRMISRLIPMPGKCRLKSELQGNTNNGKDVKANIFCRAIRNKLEKGTVANHCRCHIILRTVKTLFLKHSQTRRYH